MHGALTLVLTLLAVTVCAVAVFRAFNLPAVLAYLAVGAALGPHAAGLVPDNAQARYLAEFGVVFLMFSIGLEFSLPRLFAMKRIVLGLGGLQVLGSMLLFGLLCWLLGQSLTASFAVASVITMSSTAMLSKLLVDRMELETPHGRQVIGVLLFQDLAVVPLLILIPALAQPGEALGYTLFMAALKAVAVLALILYFGQRLMKRWFTIVARRKSSELFMLNVLFITLGLSWVTEMAGLSLALGAFLAGMLISETEFRIQVEEDIKPFRDMLLGLFMITVGMFLDVHVIVSNLQWVLLILLGLLLLKFAVVAGASRWLEGQDGTAVRAGLWLCAGGEFGFVLLTLAADVEAVPHDVLQLVMAALVLSLLIAPIIVQYSDKIVLRFVASEWMLRSMELTRVAAKSIATDKHVIICGYGRTGQYLARLLEQEGIGYVALDLDPDRIQEAAAAGDPVVFGDSSRHETLVAAGLMRASAVVIAYNDEHATTKVLHHVLAARPGLPVIARSQDERDMERLIQRGAAEVVPEMLETSIMLATHTLTLIGTPIARVIRRMRQIRTQRYSLMKGFFLGASDMDEGNDAQEARLHSVSLPPGAYGVSRRLGDLVLDVCPAKVAAVRRRGVRSLDPAADMLLEAGDVVVLLGLPGGLAAAEAKLLKGS
ncbi:MULTISPECIES: monovalent cation:proton antiporter family protein [unclassified Uliginosibacterium]|uniref:monovalent cation:proton antiporter family protein n=1 Tax=unclassified Uliginosibacterium TaxID=2621521 RepID=UPI000C7A5E6A|nr:MULTISPECIES: monovalent cation:proton antiporter family protein [unclassified Uliginosibacterium]MDO6387410.1 cation:proton antiporter [Uliginosibacterium sp. 31-12]PLK47205.1 potassium transporter [Uliginosibacterium sp. TH139]